MKLANSQTRKLAIAIAMLLFFSAAFFSPLLWRGAGGEAKAQTKYPNLQTQNTMNSTQTLEVSGKLMVGNQAKLLDDVFLDKLKDISLPNDRILTIGPDGKVKTGPPVDIIPGGIGGGGGIGGIGGGGNQNTCTGFHWNQSSNGVNNIYNCAAGNVGIGTATPTEKLDVSGNGHFTGSMGIGAYPSTFLLEVNGTGHFSGNVNIGNAGQKLEVRNEIQVRGNVAPIIRIVNEAQVGTNTRAVLQFNNLSFV